MKEAKQKILDLKYLEPKKRKRRDLIGEGAMGQIHKGRTHIFWLIFFQPLTKACMLL
jgi:hypothetical protein